MHATNRRAALFHCFERARIQRAAGVQNCFAAQLFPTDPRQLLRNFGHSVVRHGDENQVRRKDLPRHSCTWNASANESNGPARTRFAPCYNRADLPALFAQAVPQGASHTPCANQRQARLHHVLG